jgi:phosphatidylethanolamine-binding protein (PEBP) family uncharacterized protein
MAALALESSAFEHAQAIPSRYTCDGDEVSPPLRWTNVPEEARSLALLVGDPDAPRGVFTHWVAWGLDGVRATWVKARRHPARGETTSERSATEGLAHRGGTGRIVTSFTSTRSLAISSSIPARESPSWSRRSRGTC